MNVPSPIPQIAPAASDSESPKLELVHPSKTAQQDKVKLSANRQFTLAATVAVYCGVILVGVSHHEPWADEAQAWLLSRDLGYRYLVFHQLAYEGHPPLWYTILWLANHWLHLPYQALGWIGGLCAIAGCWFFCRYSPLPTFIRVLFPFTYFMAFQYAIVARPYVLLPLFTFMAAHFFAAADRRPWRFVATASALSLLSASGVMIANGLIVSRAWYAFQARADIPTNARKRLIVAAIMFAAVLALVARVNWPPPDHSFARLDRPVSEGNFGLGILPRDISVALVGSAIPSVALLVIVGAWCACRSRFLPFVLPVAFVLAFFVKVYGNLWHCGSLTLAAIAALWIAWTVPVKWNVEKSLKALALIGLTGLFAVHIYWTARTLMMDYSRPYSGSSDAAKFLRSVGAQAESTCGFNFHSVAIQPYFQDGIFQNWPHGESFWRLELGNRANYNCVAPKWVVFPLSLSIERAKQELFEKDRYLRSLGYVPAHVSRGSLFFEGKEAEPADFVIYRLQP